MTFVVKQGLVAVQPRAYKKTTVPGQDDEPPADLIGRVVLASSGTLGLSTDGVFSPAFLVLLGGIAIILAGCLIAMVGFGVRLRRGGRFGGGSSGHVAIEIPVAVVASWIARISRLTDFFDGRVPQ